MIHASKITANILILTVFLLIIDSTDATIEDMDREIAANFPYGRGMDNEQVQLARLLLSYPRGMGHPKRNSELINSLLGLPKNMNNAGK
ncbi:hypothetical protein KQX54_007564 [Cotesia glomerata]|uniref:Uncharacterized protein n=1 Tax=Cotesia glomerata TaxID=32391 RepID=A0AAV7J5K7_COTGL|nr:hypothetical protein KQX54_007564 [Cotesia glomerata]